MTLEKIAKTAGVSVSTVSKALSESKEISEKTKKRVFDAAKKLGCFEKYYKPKYHKPVIALICPEIKSSFYASIASKLEKALDRREASMVLSITNFSLQTCSELIKYHANFAHTDGIIVIDEVSDIVGVDIPIVAFSHQESKFADCIAIDIQSAIDDAIAYLKHLGHKKIGFIGEALTESKLKNFYLAMQKASLSINEDYIIISSKRFEDAGYECMDRLLLNTNYPTAIVAAYDNIAIGAIMRMRESGLDVPNNFSIIGMDDIAFDSYFDVPLTSIGLRSDDLCEICLDLIFKKLKNKYFKAKQKIIVQSELVLRESVKDIRKNSKL